MRESQRYTALAALERRPPPTLGGLGAEVCRVACAQGMTVASSETERSLLRGFASQGDVDRSTGSEASNHLEERLLDQPQARAPYAPPFGGSFA